MSERDLRLIDTLIERAAEIAPDAEDAFDAFQRRGEMILKKIFGADSHYASELAGMYFGALWSDATDREEYAEREKVLNSVRDLLQTAREEIELDEEGAEENAEEDSDDDEPEQIFIVHGHDDAMKQSVARLIERLGYDPTILHEQPNRGRTIIEKFDDHADVDFAVVLLSPDDVVPASGDRPERYRARQNVILELGYFLGRIGRENVTCIYRQHDNFELPSDYEGVVYIPFDAAGAWKYQLATELREAEFEIDMNDIK